MQSETLGDGVAVFPGNFESDPLYGHIRHSDPGHPLGIDQPSTVDAYEPIVQQTLPLRNPGSRRIEPAVRRVQKHFRVVGFDIEQFADRKRHLAALRDEAHCFHPRQPRFYPAVQQPLGDKDRSQQQPDENRIVEKNVENHPVTGQPTAPDIAMRQQQRQPFDDQYASRNAGDRHARRFEARSAPGNDSLAQNIPGNIVVERNTPCRNSYPQLAITEASISTTTHQ